MLPRRTLLANAGALGSCVLAGCQYLADSGNDYNLRDSACSHVPDDAEEMSYTTDVVDEHVLRDRSADVALLTATDHVEETVARTEVGSIGGVATPSRDLTAVDFDQYAVLLWETETTTNAYATDLLTVTSPAPEVVQGYACTYREARGAGQEHSFLTYVVAVEIDSAPDHARLVVRRHEDPDEDPITLTLGAAAASGETS